MTTKKKPNIVFIFADEWRAQATGYNGDPNCDTPVLDALAAESLDLTHAVSGCSVCCPYRGSLMTGQYPLTNGLYLNDVELNPNCHSIARAFKAGGYETGYIGKWHIYGSPEGQYERRSAYVPREYQMGFDYWKGFECTHNYNKSHYYFNDDPTKREWGDYDAFAQSRDAAQYIKDHAGGEKPYMVMLSWGPPHFPLHTAPERYREAYAEREIILRENVPEHLQEKAIEELRGYYAHIAAIDEALAIVREAVRESGEEDNTIFILTADHGDMRQSQGLDTKLFPWEESIRVPFLLRWPALTGDGGTSLPIPLDAPDIMPTLLGLCELPVPDCVDGRDWSPEIRGEKAHDPNDAAFLNMTVAFTEISFNDMKEYRGLRSHRYTYVRNIEGPWLLYDNEQDPYQKCNLINKPEHAALQQRLEEQLQGRLQELGDEFLPSKDYILRDGYGHYKEVFCPPKRTWTDPWVESA